MQRFLLPGSTQGVEAMGAGWSGRADVLLEISSTLLRAPVGGGSLCRRGAVAMIGGWASRSARPRRRPKRPSATSWTCGGCCERRRAVLTTSSEGGLLRLSRATSREWIDAAERRTSSHPPLGV